MPRITSQNSLLEPDCLMHGYILEHPKFWKRLSPWMYRTSRNGLIKMYRRDKLRLWIYVRMILLRSLLVNGSPGLSDSIT